MIPLVNLRRQYIQIKEEIDKAVSEVLESGQYILGRSVAAFEKEFAKFCGCKYGVGVASGSDALMLSLRAIGIRPGDEVLTPAHTFVATVNAVVHVGAKPVLVDIDSRSYNINVGQVKKMLGRHTKAIIPVHMYGNPANMKMLRELVESSDIFIVEDACQAHGARYHGRPVGGLGDCGCFSFYPSKNLGGYGDGGIVVTNNEEIAERIKQLRNYGQKDKYHHKLIGVNSRLDELQAAILRVKLRHLEEWIEQRKKIARRYNNLLDSIQDILCPVTEKYSEHAYHLYVIRTKRRDALRAWLNSEGISTGVHYPKSIHLQKAYFGLWPERARYPEAEKCCREVLSLPMFPELEDHEILKICNSIMRFLKS